ncbi:hypothetical protein ACXR0O_00875 [Verrucomicrobiota bacterium sgz303538]
MQATQVISVEQLRELLDAAFAQGPVVAKETYSAFGATIRQFTSTSEILADMERASDQCRLAYLYSFYYPEARGQVAEKRVSLIPEKCGGHTFRYTLDGWGWIHIQCDLRDMPMIRCRVCVNSPERATAWEEINPEFGSPGFWEWPIIKKKAGKLVRLLRKQGKETKQTDAGNRRSAGA